MEPFSLTRPDSEGDDGVLDFDPVAARQASQKATQRTNPLQARTPASKPATPSPLSLHPILNHADAMKSEATTPPSIVEGLILDETVTCTSAQPHGMKSLSWLAACMQAPSTHKVWNHFDASRVKSTLFIETEDPQWLVEKRIQGLTLGLPKETREHLDGFHYWCPGPFDLVKYGSELTTKIKECNPDFVVLSTLQNSIGGRDMKDQEAMAPVMEMLIRIVRNACPVNVITHSPWDTKQRRAVGAITQTANYTTTLHYKKLVNKATGETLAHVALESKAGGDEPSFHLRLAVDGDPKDPASVRAVVFGGEGWPKGFIKEQVLAALRDDPDAPDKQIADEVGCSSRYVRQLRAEVGTKSTKGRKKMGADTAGAKGGGFLDRISAASSPADSDKEPEDDQ